MFGRARIATMAEGARVRRIRRPATAPINKAAIAAAIIAAFAVAAPPAKADDGTTFAVSVQDHPFQPAVFATTGTAIVFEVKNPDAQPVEFVGEPLQLETVIEPSAESLYLGSFHAAA
jgi:hypothetical protein